MYKVNVTIGFTFDMNVDANSQSEAKKKVETMISEGAISLKLPKHENLDMSSLKVTVKGLKNDSINSIDGFNNDGYDDSESAELLKAYQDMNNRIASNHK